MTTEQFYQRLMGRVLRVGVALSSFLMALGLLIGALQATPIPMPNRNPTLGELLSQILSGQLFSMTGSSAITLMFTGLVVLMLTPFIRVATALVIFWKEHDRRFTNIALVVLLMLMGQVVYSLW